MLQADLADFRQWMKGVLSNGSIIEVESAQVATFEKDWGEVGDIVTTSTAQMLQEWE